MNKSNGPSFAERLKEKADRQSEVLNNTAVNALFDKIIFASEAEAERGGYSYRTYDTKLKNSLFSEALKLRLKALGFKVSVYDDLPYSEHAGETMMCVEVKW